MPDDAEIAAAFMAKMDGTEIASLLLEGMMANASRENRPMEDIDNGVAVGGLLIAAWEYAKRASPDEATARRLFVQRLRSFADGVECGLI